MKTLAYPQINGMSFECPKCKWKVTISITHDWEMLQIDKIMVRHVRRCKG